MKLICWATLTFDAPSKHTRRVGTKVCHYSRDWSECIRVNGVNEWSIRPWLPSDCHWMDKTSLLSAEITREWRGNQFIECFSGRHTGGGQFYLIFAVLRALFSCSKMSLFYLETSTPVKATPWSTAWSGLNPKMGESDRKNCIMGPRFYRETFWQFQQFSRFSFVFQKSNALDIDPTNLGAWDGRFVWDDVPQVYVTTLGCKNPMGYGSHSLYARLWVPDSHVTLLPQACSRFFRV